jgi:hypothetical protein
MLADNNGKFTSTYADLQKELDRQIELKIKSEKLTKAEADSVREYSAAAKEKARTTRVLETTTEEATHAIEKETIKEE